MTTKNSQKSTNSAANFQFRKNDSIGEAGAEDELSTLYDCFIETDDFRVLKDMENPKRIILGGTGSGKTALIEQFYNENKDRCTKINLKDASADHLSNAETLNLLEDKGINLHVAYEFLWRHVLSVELLRKKYNITNRNDAKQTIGERFLDLFTRDKTKERAFQFLESIRGDFWNNTSENVKTVTSYLNEGISGQISAKFPGKVTFQSNVGQDKGRTEEMQFQELQRVVSQVQINNLTKILGFLDEDVFSDDAAPYYVLIDQVDENWVDKKRKYNLIRALIQTIKTFKRVRNVKIILALRTDVYRRALEKHEEEGFQHDKIQALLLPIKWTKQELVNLVDKRINKAFKHRYTKGIVNLTDIEPKKSEAKTKNKAVPFFDHILSRSFHRPRHLILFINECIELSDGRSLFTKDICQKAERKYSESRLQSIRDEWLESRPELAVFIDALRKNKENQFKVEELKSQIHSMAEEMVLGHALELDNPIVRYFYNASGSPDSEQEKALANLVKRLFEIGMIGVKAEKNKGYKWNIEQVETIKASNVNMESSIRIHPMFWMALEIPEAKDSNFVKLT